MWVFLRQSNELLIFPLFGVSTYSFRIPECCSLSQHRLIFPFFHFLFLFSFFSPLDISFMLFIFLYSTATVASSALKLSLLWHCAVYPCTLCTHPCCLFSLHVFLFLSQSAPATLYPLHWCSLPCLFFCNGFFLNLHSHLSISPPPSHLLLLLSNHSTPFLPLSLPFPYSVSSSF